MDKKYIIIPGCCDLNRGDQSLGWETKHIAEDAGFIGNYSILAERGEPIEQSREEGYNILIPVLEHPSRKFKNKDNIVYDKKTKLKWGIVALKDFFFSYAILKPHIRRHLLNWIKDKKIVATIRAFEEADAIFMKGGGLIQSHGGLLSIYATYYRIYHILLAQAFDKPVYILPNSFGPFEGPGVKKMVRNVLKKCKLVTAREKKSVEAVKRDLGIDISLFPDLAFFLENGSETRSNLITRFNIPIDRKIVAVTMRPYRFPNSHNPAVAYNIFKKEMRSFIMWLYSAGYMPLIIEHTFAITSHENDGDCINDVIKGLDTSTYRLLSDRTMNCKALKSVYGSCDYIIGTRFHSLIFSLSNGVPGIAISYDGYKSTGIMEDMHLKDYVVDIADVRAELLQEKFASIIEHTDEIRCNIQSYIVEAEKKREELIALMEE